MTMTGMISDSACGASHAKMMEMHKDAKMKIEELVRRLSPPLLRFFSFSQVSVAEAEDLLQDCWLRIHRSRQTCRASEPVLPWIFAIARHTRLDGYRRTRRRMFREVLVADPPENLSIMPETRGDGADDLMNLLRQLPGSQREVIQMLKVSGMSLEDVARATSSSVGHQAYDGEGCSRPSLDFRRVRALPPAGVQKRSANPNR